MLIQEAPVSCKEFIAHTLQTRGGVISPSGGTLEEIYPWGADGAMAEVETRRLRFQEETTWGSIYKSWHEDVLRVNPRSRLAVIGTSGQAEQVKFVLSTYPEAEVVVVELDPKKVEAAKYNVSQTHQEAVVSGRVAFVAEDAIKYLGRQQNSFDYIGADKVAIHLRSKPENETEVPPRHQLYRSIESALTEGGIFHKSDIHAVTWRACADADFTDHPATQKALEVLGKLMPVVLDLSWPKRGALLWQKMEDMIAEPMSVAPKLQVMHSMTRIYEAPLEKADSPEGMVSQLIGITPALGIEMRRRQLPDNLQLSEMADRAWVLAEQFIGAVTTPGVRIALPDYNHFAFRKVS